ncbi:MAG: hypothetical protein GAK43_00763 [Stenotrophomonas maltophilia]|nr:MAG: hypothetical protein GAK43_00763 [Stenotrophomonas maltophilia]
MNVFYVQFQDGLHIGATVLCSFARQLSAGEACCRLRACYPLRDPQRLSILYLAPLLGGAA